MNNDTKVTLDLLPDGPEKQLLLLEDEVLKLTIAMADEGPSERGSSPPAAEERCLLLLGKLQRLTAKYEGAASSKVAKNKSSIRSDKGSKVAPDLTSDGPKMVLLENEVRKLTAITAAGASSTGTGSLSSEERDLLLMDALQKLTAKLEHAMGINLPDCPSDNKVAVDLLPDGPERQILLLELEVEKLIASSTAGSTTSEGKCLVLMQELQKLTVDLESATPATATNGSGNTTNANNQLLLLEGEVRKLAATATAEPSSSGGSMFIEKRREFITDELDKLTANITDTTSSIANFTDQDFIGSSSSIVTPPPRPHADPCAAPVLDGVVGAARHQLNDMAPARAELAHALHDHAVLVRGPRAHLDVGAQMVEPPAQAPQ